MSDCKFFDAMQDYKIMDKNSASNTIIISDSKLYAKLFPSYTNLLELAQEDEKLKSWLRKETTKVLGLLYELEVYKFVTQNIYLSLRSPNFLPLYGYSINCPIKKYPKDIIKKLSQYYGYDISQPIYDKNLGIDAIFTENLGQNGLKVTTLRDLFEQPENKFSPRERSNVFFQLIFALSVMERFKMMHNDLHSGNVLVLKLPSYTIMKFVYNDKEQYIKTRYVPYIFDWDLSYVECLGKNIFLEKDHCAEFGVCNSFDPYFDLYTVTCDLWLNKNVTGFITYEGYESNVLEYLETPMFADSYSRYVFLPDNILYDNREVRILMLDEKTQKRLYPKAQIYDYIIEKKVNSKSVRISGTNLVLSAKGAQALMDASVKLTRDVYKINRSALVDLVGEEEAKRAIPEGILRATYKIYGPLNLPNEDGKFFAIDFYKGYVCRLTQVTSSMKTPLEILESYQNISDVQETDQIFTLPTEEEAKTVFELYTQS